MTRGGEEAAAELIGAAVSSVISNALNRLGNALEAAGREQTWQSTAFTNFEVSANHLPKCIQIVRGEFLSAPSSDKGADSRSVNDHWTTGSSRYQGKGGQLAGAGVRLARRPHFLFEGRFRQSSDPSVLAIVPTFVDFSKPLGTRAFRFDEARSISLTFAFHPPGKAATEITNPSTNLVLGELSPEATIDFDSSCIRGDALVGSGGTAPPAQPVGPPAQPNGPLTQPGAPPAQPGGPPSKPAQSPSATNGATGVQSGQLAKTPTRACTTESLWFRLSRTDNLAPLSLTVASTEVQGKNEFLMFLSDVFKGSKEALEKVAKETLIESEREKVRLAAIQADNEAAVAYDQAATAALAALEVCKADPTISKAGAARIKQHATNLSAAKAGISQPFKTLVPLNGLPDTIQQACESALTGFN